MIKNHEIENHTKSLIRLTKLLFSMYVRVYNLEIEGMKDTVKYEKEMNLLIMTVKNIDNYYDTLSSNLDTIVEIREYLTTIISNQSQIYILNFESTMSQSDINSIILRIILQLDNIINKYAKEYYDTSKELSDIFKYKMIDIYNYVNTEILKNYLILVQESIDNRLNALEKTLNINIIDIKKLIKVKYDNAFLDFGIEKCMISSNFKVSNSLLRDSKNKLDELNIDISKYNRIKNKRIVTILITKIREILSNNNGLEKENNILNLIFKHFYLRSLFLMLNEEVIADVNDWFHEYINSKEYSKKYKNNHINEEIIVDAFKSVNEDKSNYQSSMVKKSK